MDKINPNNPLFDKLKALDYKGISSASWEHARVLHLLQVLNLKPVTNEIKQVSSDSLFTFDVFNELVSDFPVYLFAEALKSQPPIHRDDRSVHPLWFKSFKTLPFVKLYTERLKTMRVKIKRPVGMVFPRKGFQQGMILHNGDHEKFVPLNSSCHLYKAEDGNTMVVQPFTGFLEHVRTFFKE